MNNYVHGYSKREVQRLSDQANTLDEIIHGDSIFKNGSKILEIGCGTGSQTVIMAKKNSSCHFTSIDITEESLEEAKKRIKKNKITNVTFEKCDIRKINYEKEYFDYIVICFVLEHISNIHIIFQNLRKVLKQKGKIMVIEGDHGSTYFYPDSNLARKTIECQVQLQKNNGGNANIGRELFLILQKNNFNKINVTPKMIYVDPSKPILVEGFTKNTFIAMIEGVKDDAIKNNMISENDWKRGIEDLYKTISGIFCYTFFKGWAEK
jgi:protein-L-isoaspartate O-methyltransferase